MELRRPLHSYSVYLYDRELPLNLQEISTDVLRNDSYWLSLSCIPFAILFLVLAIVSAAMDTKWYHPKKLLVVLAFVAAGVGSMAFAANERALGMDHYNETVSTRTAEVRDWLQSEYEATASDDVIESVYLAMYYENYFETFLIEGSEGVIEATISVTDDGEFHIMHNSAEVRSSSK